MTRIGPNTEGRQCNARYLTSLVPIDPGSTSRRVSAI
jgi:hypothetical protein